MADKCFNCGPGAPNQHDLKVLCSRCECLYCFDKDGRMMVKTRTSKPAIATCLDCSLPYSDFPLDVVLPRAQWLEINPDDSGLLCAACIVKRASKVPGCTVVHAILEIAPRQPDDPRLSSPVSDEADLIAEQERRWDEKGT